MGRSLPTADHVCLQSGIDPRLGESGETLIQEDRIST